MRAEPRVGPLVVALAAIAVAVLWPSVTSLAASWRDIHDYQHGYLIALVAAAWLALVARRRWSAPARPSLAGLSVLAALLFGWIVALTSNSLIAHQLLFPAVLWAAIWAACGWVAARAAIAPVTYLYFATPVWEYTLPILQQLSVYVTETSLAWLGVSAQVHEFTVHIPNGTFQIVEGCSGKRYFMVTLAVAVLAAAVNRLRGRRALVFVLIAGALALIANWIRIVIVIYAGYVTDMQSYLVAVEHLTLGNVIFVVLLLTVFALARWMSGGLPQAPRRAHGAGRAAASVAAPAPRAMPRWSTALPLVLLCLVWVITSSRAGEPGGDAAPGAFPLATSQWQGPLPAGAVWAPAFGGVVGERRAAYLSTAGMDAGTVEIYIGTYGAQQQGRELVQYGNTLLAPGTWHRAWPYVTQTLPSRGPALATFEAQSADGARWLLAYLYDVGGWHTNNPALAQLAYGLRSIRRPAPSGVVALAVRCRDDCAAARARAGAFWDDMSPQILGMLPSGRGN
ncbi:MAG: exosortase [Steroidobacteraceae bacterium]